MRRYGNLFDIAEWLTEPPTGGPIQKWIVGVGLASLVTIYGLACCFTQRASTLNITIRGVPSVGRGFWLALDGIQAVSLGLVIACIGAFIHFQWYWGNHPRLFPLHEIAKYLAAFAVFVAAMAHLFAMLMRS